MQEILTAIEPISLKACGIAFICGFLIGLERQLHGKPAGIRTSILICLGAYSFVVLASHFRQGDDSMRVLGQVVTGVGFLGAGVMMSRNGAVYGVTSAAVIWILAAIGCLIGFEKYYAAIAISLITLFSLLGINYLERIFKKLRRGVHREPEDQNE